MLTALDNGNFIFELEQDIILFQVTEFRTANEGSEKPGKEEFQYPYGVILGGVPRTCHVWLTDKTELRHLKQGQHLYILQGRLEERESVLASGEAANSFYNLNGASIAHYDNEGNYTYVDVEGKESTMTGEANKPVTVSIRVKGTQKVGKENPSNKALKKPLVVGPKPKATAPATSAAQTDFDNADTTETSDTGLG